MVLLQHNGLKLKRILEEHGAKVVITRTTNDVMLTNIDRARMLNEAGVDVALPNEGKLWLVYMYAVPTTLIVLLILNSIWGNRRRNFAIISALIWTTLLCVYFTTLIFGGMNMWLLFIIGIPGQIIVGLWSGLRYKENS